MKQLVDFEKELDKCSRCALCQAECPLYKVEQNECLVSKGKFAMLKGVVKKHLTLNKNINKYLDMCIKCGKCSQFCPSSIDACHIFNVAKYEYAKKLPQSKLINFLFSKTIFSNLLNIFNILTKPFRPKRKNLENPQTKVLYFKGCVNKICPRTDKYLHKILKNQSIEIIEKDFDCCGLPFLSEGNLERFEEVAKLNSQYFNCMQDYIVCDCASCTTTLKSYPKYVENLDFSNYKFLNWGDIIANNNIKFKFKKNIKVTFHKPCHLENDDFFEKIISNCTNVEYTKMNGYDECCGLAGSFSLKNPKLSNKLAKIKANNIIKTNAEYVITTCPACIIGLKKALFLKNRNIKVVSLLEFLSKAEIIN